MDWVALRVGMGWHGRLSHIREHYFAGDLVWIWNRSIHGPSIQHAILVMPDGQLINLPLAFSHLKLDSVLVDSSSSW